jgi:hypothetical protein
MDWVVEVSEDERRQGSLSEAARKSARSALNRFGCALLRGVLETDRVDAMRSAYLAQFGHMNAEQMAVQAEAPPPNPVYWVGEGRYEITPRLDSAFGDPHFFANPLLHDFLLPILGGDMRLSGLTVVVSHPGSQMQHTHRDHPLLFENLSDENPKLPAYAINVTVPLVDVDEETGPTGIWLGSHRWPTSTTPEPKDMTMVPFQRGDCVLVDYRTLHAGLPNRSELVRPFAYLVYTRTWFFDEINHRMRPSLSMTLEEYEALPESIQPLLSRAFSQHMRARYFSSPPR